MPPARGILELGNLQNTLWGRRIISAENGSGPSLSSYKALASNWETCACGHQSNLIPRHRSGEPIDDRLASLGVDFYEAICGESPVKAAEAMVAIEFVAARILSDLQKKEHHA